MSVERRELLAAAGVIGAVGASVMLMGDGRPENPHSVTDSTRDSGYGSGKYGFGKYGE